jgi:hypothetical protein
VADPGNAATHQAFSLYAANGRIYVSNVDQKLIDLGSLTQEGDGFAWQLDGNKLSGRGLPDEVAALRDVVNQMASCTSMGSSRRWPTSADRTPYTWRTRRS